MTQSKPNTETLRLIEKLVDQNNVILKANADLLAQLALPLMVARAEPVTASELRQFSSGQVFQNGNIGAIS